MIENFEIKRNFFNTPYEKWQDPWIGCTLKETRRVNLIVGKNGVGKTLLLENIFYQSCGNEKSKYINEHWSDLNKAYFIRSWDKYRDCEQLDISDDREFVHEYAKNIAEIINPTVKFNLKACSDTVINALHILFSLATRKNGILLLDNFNNNFHYAVIAYVWKMIFELSEKFNVQVFAVTHSWDCIVGFAKASSDEAGAIYRISTSAHTADHGKKIITRFGYEETLNFIENDREVR